MTVLFEERILFLLIIIFCVPAWVYACEKVLKRKIWPRYKWIILLLYVALSMFYFDIVEEYYRNYYAQVYTAQTHL